MFPPSRETPDWTLVVGMAKSMVRVIKFDPNSWNLAKKIRARREKNNTASEGSTATRGTAASASTPTASLMDGSQ